MNLARELDGPVKGEWRPAPLGKDGRLDGSGIKVGKEHCLHGYHPAHDIIIMQKQRVNEDCHLRDQTPARGATLLSERRTCATVLSKSISRNKNTL